MTADQESPDPVSIPRILDREDLEDQTAEIARAIGVALDEDLRFALFVFRPETAATKFITNAGELTDVELIVYRWHRAVWPEDTREGPDRFDIPTAELELNRLRMYLVNAEVTKCSHEPADIVDVAIARIREIKDRYRKDVPPGRRIL
jgi:hypothetical protein